MKYFLRPLLAVGLAAGLVACGSDGDDAATTSSTTAASTTTVAATTTTAAAAAYPVTVDHAYGQTTIAAAPQRIVALGVEDADIALALGVSPVAIPKNRPLPVMPWTQAAMDANPLPDDAEVEVLAWDTDLPYEQIAALKPDLILGVMAGIDEDAYGLLTAIAPTLAHTTEKWSDPWQDQTREIAEALGRSDAAETLITATEQELATSAAEHPDFAGTTFSVALISEAGTFGLLTDPDAVTIQILGDLGMVQNPALTALSDANQDQFSLEQAELLDSDVTFVYWFDPALQAQFEAEPLFAALGVVQRDAVISVSDEAWRALRSPSVLSMPWVVDQLAPQIDAALG